ncbi:flippase [Nitrospinae bacterium AH_259_B05_G02_I21]|nr:flippase [Nitrospinae bacterium AH_259_B05_G02_I21]MDA2931648.1 flippase [Nitrospinae bacterium AH-259-F20]
MTNDTTAKALEVIAAGAGVLMVGTLIGRVAGYGFRYMVAIISPETLGIFSLCMTLLGIVSTVAFLGMKSGIVRYVAFYRGRQDSARIKGTILTSLKLVLGMSIGVSVVVALVAKPLALTFFHRPEAVTYVFFVALILPFYTAEFLLAKGLIAFKAVTYRVAVFDLSENLGKVLFCALLMLLGLHVWAALLGYGLAIVASLVLALYFLEFRVFSIFRSPEASIPNYGELIRYSTPLLFSGIIGFLLIWTDNLMLGYFLTLKDVGLYNGAALLAFLVFMGNEFFIPLFFPSISEMYGQGQNEGVRNLYFTVTKWSLAIGLPICILLLIKPKAVLTFLFGPVYGVAAVALVFLSLGRLAASLSHTSTQMINMVEKTHYHFWVTLVTALVNLGLNAWWIPRYGINGAAAATATALFFQAVAFIWLAYREFGYHIFTPPIRKLVGVGASLGLVFVAVTGWGSPSLGVFLLTVAFFGFAYAGLGWAVGAVEDHDRLLWRIVKEKSSVWWSGGKAIAADQESNHVTLG